jgi:hypothetical protein
MQLRVSQHPSASPCPRDFSTSPPNPGIAKTARIFESGAVRRWRSVKTRRGGVIVVDSVIRRHGDAFELDDGAGWNVG